MLAIWRNPRTGTFCASEGEPKISCDISQWTDRNLIPSGRSRSPSASMNLPLAISTRSLLASHGGYTRTVPEKVHAVPHTRKQLSFPWLREICRYSWDQFTLEYQVCTFYATEFRPGSFPTPTQLLLSIFSTVVCSPILPVHSLESAVSTIPCRVQPSLQVFPARLRASGQLQSRCALRTSILRMFRDRPVNPPNPTEGLMRSGKDWTLMLQPYLFLFLKVFDEDWIRRLANQDHHRPLRVQR